VRSRALRNERGQATVEFAIVVPLVMLLILGIIEFSKAFNYWITLNHLSNEGARWAAVDRIPGDTAPTRLKIKQYVLDQISSQGLRDLVDGQDPNGVSDPNLCNIRVDAIPALGQTSAAIGDPVAVTVRVPGYSLASLGESFLGDFGKITLSGKSTMRLEQVPTWATTPDPCP
jgi:Flp pilus assembly protein TadG